MLDKNSWGKNSVYTQTIAGFSLEQDIVFSDFTLEQGQGFDVPAAHPHPSFGGVPPRALILGVQPLTRNPLRNKEQSYRRHDG